MAECCCGVHDHSYRPRKDAAGAWWECYWCGDQQNSDPAQSKASGTQGESRG